MIHRRAIKEDTIAINRGWVYDQACRLSHDIYVASHSFITYNYLFKLITKTRLSNNSFIYKLVLQFTKVVSCWPLPRTVLSAHWLDHTLLMIVCLHSLNLGEYNSQGSHIMVVFQQTPRVF